MRTALMVAVLTGCIAAAPVWAQQAPPLHGILPVPRLAGSLGVPYPGLALTPDFHLRIEFAPRPVADLLLDPDSNLRQRFASSMMDFYPLAGQGFHFSGGLRFYNRTNFARDAERTTHGLLYVPRGLNTGMGVRGFKRFTPAATFGYTQILSGGVMLGIEGGTLLGRVNPGMPRAFRELRATSIGNDHTSSTNPIVNMVMGVKF
ncbi:MAG: hypothetical protein ABIS51_21855 [Sphingomonas sp.]